MDLAFLEQFIKLGIFTDVHLAKSVRPVTVIDLLRCLEAFLKENISRKLQVSLLVVHSVRSYFFYPKLVTLVDASR